jgi:hypothetical protein
MSFHKIELRSGCADAPWRAFENHVFHNIIAAYRARASGS